MGFSIKTIREFGGQLKYNKPVKYIGYTIMALVAFSMIGFFAGPSIGGGSSSGDSTETQGSNAVVAKAGDITVTENELNQMISLISQGNERAQDPQMQLMVRYQAASSVIQQKQMIQAYESQGITVSNAELRAARDKAVEEQLTALKSQLLPEGKGTDADLDREIRKLNPQMGLAQLKERMAATVSDMQLRSQLYSQKWQEQAKARNTPKDDAQMKQMFEQIYLSRIYFAINDKQNATEAKKRADEAMQKLKGGAKFADVVKTYSDDPEAIKNQGGQTPGTGYLQIQNELAFLLANSEDIKRVIDLKQGDLSEPLGARENQGYYIFLMRERKTEVPKDFEEKKEQYRDQYIGTLTGIEQNQLMRKIPVNTKPEFNEPLLRVYASWVESFSKPTPERLKLNKEALTALTPLLAENDIYMASKQLLQIQILTNLRSIAVELKNKEQKKEAEDQLLAAYTRYFQQSGTNPSMRKQYAELLIEKNMKKQAIEQLELAMGEAWEPNQFILVNELENLFKKAGRPDLAAKAEKRSKELFAVVQKQQEEQQKAMMEQMKQQQEAQNKDKKDEKKPDAASGKDGNQAGDTKTPPTEDNKDKK